MISSTRLCETCPHAQGKTVEVTDARVIIAGEHGYPPAAYGRICLRTQIAIASESVSEHTELIVEPDGDSPAEIMRAVRECPGPGQEPKGLARLLGGRAMCGAVDLADY